MYVHELYSLLWLEHKTVYSDLATAARIICTGMAMSFAFRYPMVYSCTLKRSYSFRTFLSMQGICQRQLEVDGCGRWQSCHVQSGSWIPIHGQVSQPQLVKLVAVHAAHWLHLQILCPVCSLVWTQVCLPVAVPHVIAQLCTHTHAVSHAHLPNLLCKCRQTTGMSKQ